MNPIKHSIATVIFVIIIGLMLGSSTCSGQAFDEDFDLWPVDLKIGGTIVACGGGEIPEDSLRVLKSASEKEGATTAIVYFDSPDQKTAVESTFSEVKNVTSIAIPNTGDPLNEDELDTIQSANVVCIVCDKRPNKKQSQIIPALMRACGNSVSNQGRLLVTGPIVESLGKLTSDEMAGISMTRAGANLIPDSIIQTSFEDETSRRPLLSQLAANPRCVGIGIEDNTAIVLRGRKIFVAGEGQASFFLMANEDKPLRVQHVSKPEGRRPNPYETIVDLTAWRRDAIERTVDPFPTPEPDKPFVENGTLFIVGGGGMPSGLMDRMVEIAGGKEARMVYVPCSEADEITSPQRTVEMWKKMGVASATFIHTKDRNKANSDDEFLEPLKNATGIWFGGGRQWNFSDSYYGTKAHKLMKDVLSRGGVIGGSSAGASIQARYMCRANPVANFDIMAPGYERGLGFISGIAIDQHFSQRGRQKDMTQLANRYPQLLGVGIDEATALVVQKSTAEVVGKGKVHFYNRNDPVVPGEDDFLALTAGNFYDLAERKVIDVVEKPVEDDQ